MPNKKSRYFNILFRKAQNGRGLTGKVWRLLYTFYSEYVLGCDIKFTTKIGEGFTIAHAAHGSVVSPTAIIGKNVSLRQNTTIGSKGFLGAEKSPIIGDNVVIGPNVCIIGDICVGDNAVIGAGAVVVKDVPAGAVVAGNPARILRIQPVDEQNKHVNGNLRGGAT